MTRTFLMDFSQKLLKISNEIANNLLDREELPSFCSRFSVKKIPNGFEVLMEIKQRENNRYFGKFIMTLTYVISEPVGFILWGKELFKTPEEKCSFVIKNPDGALIANKIFNRSGTGTCFGSLSPYSFKMLFGQLQRLLKKKKKTFLAFGL